MENVAVREGGVIWIDLDNTPHVPFFRPIIRDLEARGHVVLVTARDAFQVCELADLLGLPYAKIGRHYGKNPLRKVQGLLWRSLQLSPVVLRRRPVLALSHGSRSQLLLANLIGIPTAMIMDYEHAKMPLLLRPRWEIVPAALSNARLQCQSNDRILTYSGIKEDVYAWDFTPDETLPGQLAIDHNRVIVTVRPPANEAHYHNPESDALFASFMHLARSSGSAQVVLLPRNKAQEDHLRATWPQWFEDSTVIVPKVAVDGLSLLWHSDLVVSGGGTMNREAAALGVPVYSIFRGPMGSIDRCLEAEGRLVLIAQESELKDRIAFRKRQRNANSNSVSTRSTLTMILNHIDFILEKEQEERTLIGFARREAKCRARH